MYLMCFTFSHMLVEEVQWNALDSIGLVCVCYEQRHAFICISLLDVFFPEVLSFHSISFKLSCQLMCPLMPPLFLRFQGQLTWRVCARRIERIVESLPRADSLRHLCFSLSALAAARIETCVQRSIEICERKKNEQTGRENGHQGQSHLQMRDFPITAFCS